jgi:hypothetical protein
LIAASFPFARAVDTELITIEASKLADEDKISLRCVVEHALEEFISA